MTANLSLKKQGSLSLKYPVWSFLVWLVPQIGGYWLD
uniref:Uncharacterized protein n=1 Tax=Arundo donax TaxID=35708 RepID=A0A0A9AHI3_ARUDO